jgi:glucosamine--fructose-6-phosphate aminotransferase (isomerizing)
LQKNITDRDAFCFWKSGNVSHCLDGALKLKEISYVRAEAFSMAEMKHWLIALVSEESVYIFLAMQKKFWIKQ